MFNLTALSLLLAAGFLHELKGDLPRLAEFFAAVVLVEPAVMILHEAAHAIVGRLVGLHIFGVTLGSGPRVIRFFFKQFFVDLRLLPLGGLCYAGADPAHSHRWRIILMIAAGPMVHVVAIIALLFYARVVGIHLLLWPPTSWWSGALLVNVLLLIVNLHPSTVVREGVARKNDGRQLLQLFRLKESGKAWIASRNLQEITACLETGRFDEAWEMVEAARPYLHTNLAFRITELGVLGACGRWSEVFEKSTLALSGAVQPLVRQPFAAWAAVAVVYNCDNLDSAEIFSDEAYSILPWDPATQTVRATVCVAQGRIDEAERYLKEAGWRGMHRAVRAAGARAWVEVHRAKGRAAQMKKWENRADTADPHGRFKIPVQFVNLR